MSITFSGSDQPFGFNFSASLGLAQRAHNAAVTLSGADVFSQLKLDRASIACELPSLACAPGPAPGYSSAPAWKVWQDFQPGNAAYRQNCRLIFAFGAATRH